MDRTTQVHRGDVIVEQQLSTGPVYFIRRVIGLPGDHVACCNARGRITVNGVGSVDEESQQDHRATSEGAWRSMTVPSGHPD